MRGFEVVGRRHGFFSLKLAAAPCGLDGEALAGSAGGGCTAGLARGRSAAEDGEGPFILVRDAKRPPTLFPWGAAAENKRTRAVALRPRLRHPRHPQRPRGGAPFRRSEAGAMT